LFAPAIVALVALTALWFLLCQQLSGEWSVNEQYNYGWFVPFFALYLFWLRWQDRPPPEIPNPKSQIRNNRAAAIIAVLVSLAALLLLLPVRLFEIANPEWRPLAWLHTASVVTLTLLYLWYVGGRPWLCHFAFPVGFIFVAVPWVTPIEGPIIQGLMRLVAAFAAETITLLGIPAQLEGNLIRVTNGLVGVNEACSGVRSLQTSLMIGLLFGELKRLSISHRVLLVIGAVAIALATNFLRAIFLVWIAATTSISEVNRWHDLAGYTIVGLVFVGTFGLAYLLGRKKPSDAIVAGVSPATMEELQPRRLSELPLQRPVASWSFPTFYFLAALCWIVAVEAGAQLWYRSHERNLVASIQWEVEWPESAPNFQQLKVDDEVRRQLRFDEGHAASWTWPTATSPETSQSPNSRPTTCVLYFFRWNPGRNSALLANLHRPDVCLPAVGWAQVADTGVRNYRVDGSLALPFRHFEFRHGARENPSQQVAHAFYCLWEDRAASPSAAGSKLPQMSGSRSSWTRAERLRTVIEGRRHLGQQMMEFVALSRGPIDDDEIDARFAQALPRLVKVTTAY
jgi:exosortase